MRQMHIMRTMPHCPSSPVSRTYRIKLLKSKSLDAKRPLGTRSYSWPLFTHLSHTWKAQFTMMSRVVVGQSCKRPIRAGHAHCDPMKALPSACVTVACSCGKVIHQFPSAHSTLPDCMPILNSKMRPAQQPVIVPCRGISHCRMRCFGLY